MHFLFLLRSIPKGIESYFIKLIFKVRIKKHPKRDWKFLAQVMMLGNEKKEASQKGLKDNFLWLPRFYPILWSIPKGIESIIISVTRQQCVLMKHPKRDWKTTTEFAIVLITSLEASQKGLKEITRWTRNILFWLHEASQKGLKESQHWPINRNINIQEASQKGLKEYEGGGLATKRQLKKHPKRDWKFSSHSCNFCFSSSMKHPKRDWKQKTKSKK